MIKGNIRYAKVAKYAYGTKLPKFAYGYNETTHQFDKTNGGADVVGGVAESYLNSTPYYAAASAASGIGKSFVKKNQTIDPNTGEVTEGYATNEGYMADGAMTAHHTTMINDVKKGDYAAAFMHQNGVMGTIYDFANAKNVREDFRKKQRDNEAAQAELDAQEKQRKQDIENKQRDMYSRAYLAENPEMGREGASVYAYGTSLNGMAIPKKAMGGNLNPIASNVDKAVGDTHEQGGITLTDNNGQPKAEIEGQEVVVDDKSVLSNRLPFTGGKSFADVGEEIGKEKGKQEEKLKTGDMFAKNGAKRTIQGLDKKMDILLKYQDVVRDKMGVANPPVNQIPTARWGTDYDGNPVWEDDDNKPEELHSNMELNKNVAQDEPQLKGDTSLKEVPQYDFSKTSKTNSGNKYSGVLNTLENASPYLDNAINYALIKKTPEIPKPIKNVAIDEMAMPLNTNYNINPTLIANNQDLKEYNKNILDNTSSSNNARASMASGFAKKLRMNNEVYGQKENIENQLKDKNALNIQAVNNRNINNHQNIDNANIAQDNKYNWDNMLRKGDIQNRYSKLGAETTNDITTGIQDKRMGKLDDEKIFYDSLKHDDASGFATLVGTSQMERQMKDPKTKRAIYDSLKRGGQTKALKQAKELYGE